MPIRPENRDRYPDDWPEVSLRIRERAGDRCECRGECGSRHEEERPEFEVDDIERCAAFNRWGHPVTGSMVVLTVAHLDHQPENCSDDNLRAMCQRCHLRYDADHHRQTRDRTRREAAEAAGQLRLLDVSGRDQYPRGEHVHDAQGGPPSGDPPNIRVESAVEEDDRSF